MEKFNTIKQLGDGTYGTVFLGTIKTTGEKVAIKKYARYINYKVCSISSAKCLITCLDLPNRMKEKYYTWEECTNLREIKVSHQPADFLFARHNCELLPSCLITSRCKRYATRT